MLATAEIKKMQNPEAWIGKRIPRNIDANQIDLEYDFCDNCQKLYRATELHALLYPQTKADWGLQQKLHVEEAQGFCPDCLNEIEMAADKIDPNWHKRTGI